jgi:cell fate (sporulation/competence/biofilm development) regulator YlbF (YheA/YmcA/DUF963 family)
MEVYNQAHALAKALRKCQVVMDYEKAKGKLDEEAKGMLRDFRKQQLALQQKQFSGEKPDELEVKRLQRLTSVITMHPTLKEVLDAEYRISTVMADIQKIIAGSIEDLFQDEV